MVFDFQGIHPLAIKHPTNHSSSEWKWNPKTVTITGRNAYTQFAYHPLSNSFWGQSSPWGGWWMVWLLFFFTLHHWEVTRNANLEHLEDDFSLIYKPVSAHGNLRALIPMISSQRVDRWLRCHWCLWCLGYSRIYFFRGKGRSFARYNLRNYLKKT